MNAILILAILSAGPFGAAIKQAAPVVDTLPPTPQWEEVAVGNTTIELPLPEAIETAEYQRTAPANYQAHKATKYERIWCPSHGWSCGMQRAVEDLAGHLQSIHEVPLEELNRIGRSKWYDLHDDLEWRDLSESEQAKFLSPAPAAKAAPASTCGPNGCPKPSYSQSRGWGWRR